MYFIQKLPTNKAKFIFKNMQDFNQTTHVGPQDPSVFTDRIKLILFLSYHFYKKINETVTQWYVTVILTWSINFPSFEVEYALQNAKCVLFNTVLFNLDCTTVSKWWKAVTYKTF